MSVQLCILKDAPKSGFDAIEIMAPDFDAAYVWLWQEKDGENRLDLSRHQMRQLRDVLNEILGRM
jgi:hypothetical protein